MNQTSRFVDFGDLYRAAFAEPNPIIKQLLLEEVKKALDRWAENIDVEMPASPRPACAEVDSTRLMPFRQVA